MMSGVGGLGAISFIMLIIYLGILGVGIYVTYLVIKALKIYIKKNS